MSRKNQIIRAVEGETSQADANAVDDTNDVDVSHIIVFLNVPFALFSKLKIEPMLVIRLPATVQLMN